MMKGDPGSLWSDTWLDSPGEIPCQGLFERREAEPGLKEIDFTDLDGEGLLMPTTGKAWSVTRDGKDVLGPFSPAELREMAGGGG